MTTIGQIQKHWQADVQDQTASYRSLEAEVAVLEERIAALTTKMEQLTTIDGSTLMSRIGRAVVESMPGMAYEVAGPQGIDCNMSLIFTPDGRRTYASFSFRPQDDGSYRMIDYDRPNDDYPKGSVGALNGMNYPDVEIPDDVNEIVAMVESRLDAHRSRMRSMA